MPFSSGWPSAISHWKGKGLRAATWGRPYEEITNHPGRAGLGPAPTASFVPGTLVRQSQALLRNRSSCNFCNPSPQWGGRNLDQPLRFCAPEIFCLTQGVTPVMGAGADSPCQGEMARRARGGRVGDYEHEVLIGAVPGAFWFLCRHGQRNSPPAGGEILPA